MTVTVAVLRGDRVRRKGWAAQGAFIELHATKRQAPVWHHSSSDDPIGRSWVPKAEDLLATDWEVAR